MRILIVEEEAGGALREGLEGDGYAVWVCASGEEGFYLATTEHFDLIILDLLLPGRDGLEILCSLRRQGVKTPVLMLSERHSFDERVRGLDAGADDYVTKPFDFAELFARVRAILRRAVPEEARQFRLADLELDPMARSVSRAGDLITVTVREFELLKYLFVNVGRAVSREMLARHVWGVHNDLLRLDNVIDTQVSRLRRKIDQRFERKLLHTVRGVGFVLRVAQP